MAMTKQNSMALQFEENNATAVTRNDHAIFNRIGARISLLAKRANSLLRERLQQKDPECQISPRSHDEECRLTYLSFLNW